MDRVLQPRLRIAVEELRIRDDQLELRPPCTRAEAGRSGTIVHHVLDALPPHVRVQAVRRLDQAFVDDLGQAMPVLLQHGELGHDARHPDPGSERPVFRQSCHFQAGLADLPTDFPHRVALDVLHRLLRVPDHVLDLLATRNRFVDLFHQGLEGAVVAPVSLVESGHELFVVLDELFVITLQPQLRDMGRDVRGQDEDGLLECLFRVVRELALGEAVCEAYALLL